MKFRKLAALLLSGAMMLSLAACGGGGSPAPADSGSEAAAPADTGSEAAAPADTGDSGEAAAPAGGGENITLVMSQRDEFLSTLVDGATAAAAEAGVKLNTVDAQQDSSKSMQFVQTQANAGDKAIIVNPVDPTQTDNILESVGDMKLVFVNRPPDDLSKLNENFVYVGSNELDSGRFQGEALADYFNAQGKTEIKYILLNGIIGHDSTTKRTQSCLDALAANGITATEASAPLACEFDRATAMDMITPLLTAGTEFDCIIANNDAMALGAIEAMEGAGMDPTSIPIVGIDCTADGAAAVASGKMFMTVFQDADGQGRGAVNAAINMINGDPIETNTGLTPAEDNPNILWVPFVPVTADNVADYQ